MLTILRKLRSKFGKTHSLYEIGTKLYQAVTSFVTQIRSLYLTGQLGNEDKEGASQIEIAEAILAYAILMHVLKQRPDFYKPMWQLSNETIATIGGFKTTELWIWSMISRFDETGIEYFDKCVVNLTNMYCAKYGHNPVAKEMSISDMSGILFQYIEKAKQEAAYLEQLNSAMFTEMLETLYSIPASERINNEINKMLGIQILRTR
ncbi:hypothetical protein IW150_000175 [Coemansia sp. RSA 2607]|nr:hypothetical protein IW150_000175 [Coemansia sp. RSA 2607]